MICRRNGCKNETADGRVTCDRCHDTRMRWKAKNPQKVKASNNRLPYNHDLHVAKKYGLKPGQYQELLDRQHGVCAVCGRQCLTGRRLAVDHDHETGEIRGLLCVLCNRAVGYLRDDAEIALKMVHYLATFQGV